MELSNDEVSFLNENIVLKDYFYDLLINIKNSNETKIIICKNSYERRFVHILAISLGLYHNRHIEYDKKIFDNFFDYQCKCKYCWEIAGKKSLIINVKVSTKPLLLSRKDKKHQNFKSSSV
jgi:hypothetical protein